jgi:hypothetical protein
MSYSLAQTIANVTKWKTSAGKSRYLRYLNGERLTLKESIAAKCAECCNGFEDGRGDCGIEACPLYPFTPGSKKPAAKRSTGGRSFPVRLVNKPHGATEGTKPVGSTGG